MGAVYRASDEHLVIPVAVKENLFLTEEYGRQFQREAHILAGLRHPNLPHVSDYFAMEHQGQYLVMDYVEGEDLRQRMERMGALPEREALLIGISICDALTYLHTRRAPIVHRDIKPGNIKVTADGQAVLVDFGLAKIMQGSQATSTGARAMTPGYSPPEQYGTARTDHRSDIYSLGATLYAAVTGVIPEDGLARMTGKVKLTPVRDLTPKISRKLAEAIERALEIDPEDRYQTADELKENLIESGELASYYQERPVISPPPSPVTTNEPGNSGLALTDEEAEKANSRSRNRRRRKRQAAKVLVPFFALLAVAAFALLIFRPDFTQTVIAYFIASPTLTAEATEIASSNIGQPTSTLSEPSSTQTIVGNLPVEVQATSDPSTRPAITEVPDTVPTAGQKPTTVTTATGGGQGQIAFASDRTGVMEVWLLDLADPQKQHQITGTNNPSGGACQPSWSPDGMRLTYISPAPENKIPTPARTSTSLT